MDVEQQVAARRVERRQHIQDLRAASRDFRPRVMRLGPAPRTSGQSSADGLDQRRFRSVPEASAENAREIVRKLYKRNFEHRNREPAALVRVWPRATPSGLTCAPSQP